MSGCGDATMNENDSSLINVNSVPNITDVNRSTMFDLYIKNAFIKISSGVSEEKLAGILGQSARLKNSTKVAAKMHTTIKTNILKNLTSEVEQMVKDEEIKKKLETLDKLVVECPYDEETTSWRPNGNVKDHVRSHVMAMKIKHKNTLVEKVRERECATEKLRNQLALLRDQVRSHEVRLQELLDLSLDCSVVDRVDAKIAEQVEEF